MKWPLLPDAATMPLYEGVTLCLLTAMSLLAPLGLRYPVRTLPVLLFETAWKVLWLGLVALPHAASGPLDRATTDVVVSCFAGRCHRRGRPVAVRVGAVPAHPGRPVAVALPIPVVPHPRAPQVSGW